MLRKTTPPGHRSGNKIPPTTREGTARQASPQHLAGTPGGGKKWAAASDTDRRRHHRFPVKNGAFVVIRGEGEKIEGIQNMSMGEIALAVFKSRPLKIGQIKDMSENGLSFEYVKEAKGGDIPGKLDILHAEGGFCLSDLDFRTISDADRADIPPYEPVRTKLSGIQFVNLTHLQRQMLDAFMKDHTKSRT